MPPGGGFAMRPAIYAAILTLCDLAAVSDARARMPPAEAQAAIKALQRQQVRAAINGDDAERLRLARARLDLVGQSIGQKSIDYAGALADCADAERRLGHEPEAERLLRAALDLTIRLRGQEDMLTATRLDGLGNILNARGRYLDAEPLVRAALAIRTGRLGERHPQTLESLSGLAYTLDLLGRLDEAEPLLRRTLDIRRTTLGEEDEQTATSYNNLAWNLARQARLDEAESLYRTALVIRTGLAERNVHIGDYRHQLAQTQTALAMVLSMRKGFDEAEKLLRLAGANVLFSYAGDPVPAEIDAARGYLLDEQGRHAEAEPELRSALAAQIAKVGPSHPRTRAALGDLAFNLLSQPERAHLALEPARQIAAILAHDYAVIGYSPREDSQRTRAALSDSENWLFLADAHWAAARQDATAEAALRTEAFGALQRAMEGSASRAVALTAARRAGNGRRAHGQRRGVQVGDLARERQTLADEWARLDGDATRAIGGGGVAGIADRQAAIGARLAEIDRWLRKIAPDYFALSRPEPLSVDRAAGMLAADEAVVLIVPTRFGTQLMALTREGLRWQRATMDREAIDAAVSTLRDGLEPELIERTGAAFDRKLAWRLHQAVIAPLLPAIADKARIFIAADGALASLPFGVLVTAPPEGSDDTAAAMRATQWFVDAHSLIQLPSLQSLRFLRDYRPRGTGRGAFASRRFTGYGAPLLGADAMIRGAGRSGGQTPRRIPRAGSTRDGAVLVDAISLRQLPSLPGTADELERMRRALGAPVSTIHLGAAANETAVKAANLGETSILAFATHGLLAGDFMGLVEPGLVLTPPERADAGDDGFLSASEITSLRLDADLVVLSACNSAGGTAAGTQALSGLARAFFFAGARSLLASHWPVYDDVAPRISTGTIAAIRADPKLSLAEALQQTIRAVRNDVSDPSLAFPSVWAPFVLIGDAPR